MGISAGLIGAAAVVGGGILTSNAARSSAKQVSGAAQSALGFQQGVYSGESSNLNPYISGGQGALQSLLSFYGLNSSGTPAAQQTQAAYNAFTQTPSYQFPLQQGNLALTRQLASMGLTGSGAALKGAVQYNQGYASQNLQSYLTGLSNIAGSGQSAATALGQSGNSAAQNVLNASLASGSANAAGTLGSTSGVTSSVGSALGSLLGQNQNTTASTSTLGQLLSSIGSLFNSSGSSYSAATGVGYSTGGSASP